MKIEVCLEVDDSDIFAENVERCHSAGAHRIELCSSMDHDGLTPPISAINLARKYFPRSGIMVMLRPREGNFCYNDAEARKMLTDIPRIAKAGGGGIVFGALTPDNQIDYELCIQVLSLAKENQLSTTFHRAFDSVKDTKKALAQLMLLEVDHVLTSGTKWQAPGSIVEGIETIRQYVSYANKKIEIIACGHLTIERAFTLQEHLARMSSAISLHTYSGVLVNRRVQPEYIKRLIYLDV